MKLKPHIKYKDSGVDWIGEIPENWKVQRLKHITLFKYGSSLSEENRNIDGKFPVFGSNGIVGYHDSYLTKGITIIIGRKGSYGQINWSADNCYPIDTTYYVNQKTTKNNIRWLYYSLKDLNLDEGSQDSTVPGLSRDTAYNKSVVLPPVEEQKVISHFLDKKTSEINLIIEKDTQLIELLKEKRTALINHVVTKGLDPTVNMKDSRVEWIGEIPEDWKVKKLKHELLLLDHKRIPLSAEVRADMEHKIYDYYGASGVIDKVENYIFNGKYILLGEDGANLLLRSTPLAFIAEGRFWVNNHAHILDIKNGNLDYFVNLLESIDYTPQIEGSAQPKLTADNLKNINILVPPLIEQNQIAEFIDKETKCIDLTIQKIQEKINYLKEYKKSLIHHVVTGKVDVREAAV